MKLVFHTNLDEPKGDVSVLNNTVDVNSCHGDILPVPRKGDKVEFPFKKWVRDVAIADKGRNEYFSYVLEVVDVTYNYGRGVVVVELHIPHIPGHSTSIVEWSEWFKKFRHN